MQLSVSRRVDDNCITIEVAQGVYITVDPEDLIAAFVPDKYLKDANFIISLSWNLTKIARLTSVEGIKVLVLGAAAQGLSGGAAVTSGLATLGGGSVAAGGAGMAGGIVVIGAAPSMLSKLVTTSLPLSLH